MEFRTSSADSLNVSCQLMFSLEGGTRENSLRIPMLVTVEVLHLHFEW